MNFNVGTAPFGEHAFRHLRKRFLLRDGISPRVRIADDEHALCGGRLGRPIAIAQAMRIGAIGKLPRHIHASDTLAGDMGLEGEDLRSRHHYQVHGPFRQLVVERPRCMPAEEHFGESDGDDGRDEQEQKVTQVCAASSHSQPNGPSAACASKIASAACTCPP